MADRGIDVVRAHLAKLPPSDSLTIAERRAQYERAEKVFPTPADVKVERVNAPAAPAEWLRPAVGGGPARGAVPPRRRLRDRLAALASPPGRRDRARRRRQRAAARLSPGARASVPGGGRRRGWPPTAGCSTRASPPSASWSRATPRAAGSRWPRCSPCASRALPRPAGGVCISPWVDLTCSGASYATKAGADPIVHARPGVEEMAQAYLGATATADRRWPRRSSPTCAACRRC